MFSASFALLGRIVTPYSANVTGSLSAAKIVSSNTALSTIHPFADLIKEHAARRVDLYFYQLISVYKLNEKYNAPIVISRRPAQLQHGRGSSTLRTHACHSALFSNLAIYFQRRNDERMDLTEAYKQTFFYQSLNSTVELPAPVNGFDGYLEGRSKPSTLLVDGLSILNCAANSACNPREGMGLFYKSMHRKFSAPALHYFFRRGAPASLLMNIAICAYEKQGTFSGANAELDMLEEYLYLILRISKQDLAAAKNYEELLEHRYLSIRDEIWSCR